MLRRIVGLVVHAQHEGVVRIGGRRGDDHFFHRAANVLARVGALGEQPRGFDHDLAPTDAQSISAGSFVLKTLKALAVDGNRVVGVRHFLREIAEDRIVLQQMRERLRVGDVVHGHKLDRRIAQRRAKNVPPDAAKTVDSYFNRHASSSDLRIAWRPA